MLCPNAFFKPSALGPRLRTGCCVIVGMCLWGLTSPTAAHPQRPEHEAENGVAEPTPKQEVQARTDVSVTIDFGDQSQVKFLAIAWREGMTVLDVMHHMEKHPRGVPFRFIGKGPTAFLQELGGQANQGADGRNWLFKVSGKAGRQSFATTRLQPGDDVLWEFR